MRAQIVRVTGDHEGLIGGPGGSLPSVADGVECSQEACRCVGGRQILKFGAQASKQIRVGKP